MNLEKTAEIDNSNMTPTGQFDKIMGFIEKVKKKTRLAGRYAPNRYLLFVPETYELEDNTSDFGGFE